MNETNTFELYWEDLTKDAQERLFAFLGGNNGNYDILPIVSIEQDFED